MAHNNIRNKVAEYADGDQEHSTMPAPDVELRQFCDRLKLPRSIEDRALHLMNDGGEPDLFTLNDKLTQSEVLSCVLFLASVEARMPYGPNDPSVQGLTHPVVTLDRLLYETHVNVKSFFEALKIVRDKVSLSPTVCQYLKSIEVNYCVVAALHHTFQTRMCPKVFISDVKNGEGEYSLPPIPESEGVSFRKKQCWVLFLLAKYQLMKDNKELYSNFQLLVCCLEFVLRQTPTFLLSSPYDTFRFESLNSSDKTLTNLCSDFDLTLNDVLDLHNRHTASYFQELLTSDGELDVDRLCSQYAEIHESEGDINEMLFLDKAWHLMPPDISNVVAQQTTSVLTGIAVSPQKAEHPGQMTPTRAAVSSVRQLMSIIKPVVEEPTDKLKDIFQRCNVDPNDVVLSLRDEFVSKFSAVNRQGDEHTANSRYSLALRLFYKVLDAMLQKESSNLSEKVLSTLLQKKEFLISMIACSVEVVLVTFGQSWNQASSSMTAEAGVCRFPWILDAFSLQAYEFYKVIESFVRAEPELPLDIIKHLQGIEVNILESLAWKETSMLFEVIGRSNWEVESMVTPTTSPLVTPTSSPIKAASSSAEQSRSAVELFLSPIKQTYPSRGSPPRADTSAVDSTAAEESTLYQQPQRKSQSLSHFLSRVCRLGYGRLCKLCNFLQISKDVQHKIWTCFEHCVTQMPELVKNRHIDQILMCCIFGMCKVVSQDVRFKSIVHEYKNMPHARPEVHKYVYIKKDKEDSIISFYNQVFLHNIKSYILQFSPQRTQVPQLSPLPKQPMASPVKSLLSKKFTVSPMKDFEFKTPASPSQMTPSTRFLYSFGDSIGSAEKFKDINAAMMARGGATSAKKRLNMDDLSLSVPKSSKTLKF